MNKSIQKDRAIKVVRNILRQYNQVFDPDSRFDMISTEVIAEHIIKNLRKNKIIKQWEY